MTDVYRAALSYARKGMPVFPCDASKKPLTARGFYAATVDEAQIETWFSRTEPPAIGIPTGHPSGVWVLDLDRRDGIDGADALHLLTTEHGELPDTTISLTPSGGQHYLFRWQRQIRCSAGKLGVGLDVRGDGGYFIAPPSRVKDGAYEYEGSSAGIAVAPPWLESLCAPPQQRARRDYREPDDSDRCRALNALRAIVLGDTAGRDEWLEIAMGYKAAGGDFESFDTWCQAQPGYDPDHVPKEWDSIAVDGGIGPGTLYHTAREHGWRDGPQIRFASNGSAQADQPMQLEEKLSKDGTPLGYLPSLSNVVEVLTKHEDFAGRVVLNELSGRIELVNGVRSYESTDAAVHELRAALDTVVKWTSKPSRQHAFDALEIAASRQRYNPVYDYLTSLQWDGVERLPFWLDDVCSVERSQYTMAVAVKMLVGAVARIFEPGCKLDTMPVLVGPQGALKSSLVRILAAPWHVDTPIVLGNKDAYQALQGAWCFEFAELASFHGKEVERLKAFFSSGSDTYRPAYGRTVVSEPRRCWFVATTNDSEFLHDPTGARRFWPVRVESVDLDAIRGMRDQLWAEAVVMYHAGEVWHLEDEAAEFQADAAEQHFAQDPWEMKISDFVIGLNKTTAGDILDHLEVEVSRRTKGDAMRITRILCDRLGWRRVTVRIGNKVTRGYARPPN